MQTFTPTGGSLALEIFDNPNDSAEPIRTLTIRLEFEEFMDPDDPRSDQKASALIEDIPFPSATQWKSPEGVILNVAELEEEVVEGSIYYYGYHNPIDLMTIQLGTFGESTISVTLKGTIDFTYEGLSRLGKPDLEWHVDLEYDQSSFENLCPELKS